ncbi:asparaginyl-tRNA synthetase [Spiroplasma sp. TIUS-1]|uniref:asparagine--tRNA ligase n=1 Tax=Spiroplasma sp. TIUS-1 TaxID=216963 RepID=UPI0013971AF1|nr:asparagine--tRNA ligase [Spiroplasma sp. TIUS-1]QHX35643.1 asparaginyl-tRNA synthetase [Spiroplasma sp. TIUS-1]
MKIIDIYKEFKKLKKEITVIGRVRSNRQGKAVSFLVLDDGTYAKDLQVVYKPETIGYSQFSETRVGAIVSIKGMIIETPNRPQPFEISATEVILLDNCAEDYPLQKKEHTLEYLREIPQLRARAKTFQSTFRIRSSAAFAIHEYFIKQNFVYMNTPIITENDAEGAGEAFVVTTRKDAKYDQDFFGKKASLTVSGQLNAEAMAQSFNSVYTFGPTFRAENSHTNKHASEFWMVEPEIAFADLVKDIEIIEGLVKHVIDYVLKNNLEDLKYCESFYEEGLIERLQKMSNDNFEQVTYKEAIDILVEASKKINFEESNIKFGMDLSTEHERYICEKHFAKPVFVTNYPKEIKSFYMKLNDDGITVAATDLLVPGIGELVGGSQREDSYDKLIERCNELKINPEDLKWYIDLRKFGYFKSAGFGLGFERLVMYLTGAKNIRDVIPFPRTPKNLLF